MAKTDVKLYSIDTYGKATTATISDVNPDATSSQLVQMGRLFNNLTQNTYTKTDRINTINCDTEGGGNKQTPTITLTTSSISLAELKTALTGGNHFKYINGISYNGDGKLYCFISPNSANPSSYVAVTCVYGTDNTNKTFSFVSGSDDLVNSITAPFDVIIRADETDNYTAATATFTVTA